MKINNGLSTESKNIYLSRQENLRKVLNQHNMDGLALNPGPSLTYLTGLHFHLSERPVVVLFPVSGPLVIMLPELEAAKLTNLEYPVQHLTYPEDPDVWASIFENGVESAGLKSSSIGVESLRMRLVELNLLQGEAANVKFLPADKTIAALRMIKDETEANLMRTAVEIAQEAIKTTLKAFRLGMTEREFSTELTLQLLRGGSDPEFPFSPIVSSGLNSANPHAVPSDRPIISGDLLVVDWGATYKGYISDLTRTYAIGPIESEFTQIGALVFQANTAGRFACQPGKPIESVDFAARSIIEQAGYGQYFIHRTGHGIGMEAHEEPYIRSGNLQKLQSGMCFTVEPGIYLPGRGGVRVEDNVMITKDGFECFSDLPRELQTLPL